MRTEVKIAIAVAAVVLTSGIVYWAGRDRTPQSDELSLDGKPPTSGKLASDAKPGAAKPGAGAKPAAPPTGRPTPAPERPARPTDSGTRPPEGGTRTSETPRNGVSPGGASPNPSNGSALPPRVTPPTVPPSLKPDPARGAESAPRGDSGTAPPAHAPPTGGAPPASSPSAAPADSGTPRITPGVPAATPPASNPANSSPAGNGSPPVRPSDSPAPAGPGNAATPPNIGLLPRGDAPKPAPRDEKATPPGGGLSSRVGGLERSDAAATKYTVKDGDTLSSIAVAQLGSTRHWTLIRDANPGLDPDHIKAGQVLNIPPRPSAARPATDKPAASPTTKPAAAGTKPPAGDKPAAPGAKPPTTGDKPAAGRSYVVQDGDTLISIARKLLGSGNRWKELFELNKDKLKSADELHEGMTLTLPADARAGGDNAAPRSSTPADRGRSRR